MVQSMKTVFLDKQFKTGAAELRRGDQSDRVAAVQLALGRIGYLKSLVDRDFGEKTEVAVRAFQKQHNLAETGVVDAATLDKIDDEHHRRDFRSEAAKQLKPLDYLSDFNARGLPRLLAAGATPRWNDAATQQAFGAFCKLYWEVMKRNEIEADCKTIALFLMDQFRKKVRLDTGHELPMPGVGKRRLPALAWKHFTADDSKGYFSQVGGKALRREYKNAAIIERILPEHSMIRGVNLSVDTRCAEVARHVTPISARKPHNRGDHHVPEIEVNDLQPGRMIFMDHDGAKGFDHAITVIAVERDRERVRRIVLAVGSYDDVSDSDPTTPVKSISLVNNYAEEVTIEFDVAGRIVNPDADPTWASEPPYLRNKEYTAKNTIMDKNAGAKLMIACWADVE
jgi:hypothetical protein